VESLPGTEPIIAIAEVLVALAASSGIILALTRDPEHWEPFDALRVFNLLTYSVGGAFLALLPFGLSLAVVGSPAVWRIASGAMVVLIVVASRFSIRMFRAAYATSRESFAPWFLISVSVIGMLNLGAQLLNGLGTLFQGILSVFVGGPLGFLALSALMFVLIIFNRPRSSAQLGAAAGVAQRVPIELW
jgi:hypothetical protein